MIKKMKKLFSKKRKSNKTFDTQSTEICYVQSTFCVCCGREITEGNQVCPECIEKYS